MGVQLSQALKKFFTPFQLAMARILDLDPVTRWLTGFIALTLRFIDKPGVRKLYEGLLAAEHFSGGAAEIHREAGAHFVFREQDCRTQPRTGADLRVDVLTTAITIPRG